MSDFKFDITKELGILSESTKGWRKELNLVSWNGADPKYDLRDWAPDHKKMSKGITLTEEELRKLNEIIKDLGQGAPMVEKYKVITLCGSTQFKNVFMEGSV